MIGCGGFVVIAGLLSLREGAKPGRERSRIEPPPAQASSYMALVPQSSAMNADRIRRLRDVLDRLRSLGESGQQIFQIDDYFVQPLGNHTALISQGKEESIAPDVLTGQDLFLKDPRAMGNIQSALGSDPENRGQRRSCMDEFVARGYRLDAKIEWDVILEVRSRDGVGRVVSAQVNKWPPGFDEAVKSCYLESFKHVEFDTEHDYDYIVQYPVCYYGRSGTEESWEP